MPETLECGRTQELSLSRPMLPPSSWKVWRLAPLDAGEVTSRIRITAAAPLFSLPQAEDPGHRRQRTDRRGRASENVAHQRPQVGPPQPPYADLRDTPAPLELVARDFHDSATA